MQQLVNTIDVKQNLYFILDFPTRPLVLNNRQNSPIWSYNGRNKISDEFGRLHRLQVNRGNLGRTHHARVISTSTEYLYSTRSDVSTPARGTCWWWAVLCVFSRVKCRTCLMPNILFPIWFNSNSLVKIK